MDSNSTNVSKDLYNLILDRKANPVDGSYTNYLFDKGIEKIGKKVGEEAIEAIISASKGDKENTIQELADLFYHALVMMAQMGITPEEVEEELKKR
ncbi:MAG TPA: phosphoribosyl-ATP diphosphatase [Clostridiales bacterium]|jgi:phosphoribosyl-ATP pyrophosphohydrolase|nr:phosphoribosyl-ATP diphosphatase [Saccharofermentanaceae bacterium]HBY32430.1 phosphoribosyl-ATP diphosphatase [Clostridiales bacterium]HBZ78643.1 phosphoribosyl-ATP diphosphatase [Clostridiales bacterium]